MSVNYRYAPHMAKIPPNPIFSLNTRLGEPGFINFTAGAPADDTFPYADIKVIANELLDKSFSGVMQYGLSEGYPPARGAMAKMISRYGISPRPDDIFITTGGQQAINLFTKIFIEPGDAVLVEAPTYSATLQILKTHRAQPIPLESDESGFLPEDLEEKIEIFNPKIVYLIPTFKNPSGSTISAERREAAAEITGRRGVLLIEDDPYRDLRYRGASLPTIKSFDRTGNVVFLTSTSKILCPGLRVGAAYVPEGIKGVLIAAKQAADMHSATLPQAIVSEYIDRGLLDPHIAGICVKYKEKLDLMLKAVNEYFPRHIDVTRPDGGLFLWCVCPDGTDTRKLLDIAIEKKVAFIPGEQFFTGGAGLNTFRLNFSNAPLESIEKGIAILSRILHEHVKS